MTCRNPEERRPGPEHAVSRVVEKPGHTEQHTAKDHVHNGPARLTIVRCHFVMNDVRTHTAPPGNPMPPSSDEQHRKAQREHRIRVLQRVERQVAAHRDVVVAEPPGGEGMAELVQAQRHDPAGDDEGEHPDVGQRLRLGGGPPGQHAADRGDGHDRQEDGAWSHRLAAPDGCSPHEATGTRWASRSPSAARTAATAGRPSPGRGPFHGSW